MTVPHPPCRSKLAAEPPDGQPDTLEEGWVRQRANACAHVTLYTSRRASSCLCGHGLSWFISR